VFNLVRRVRVLSVVHGADLCATYSDSATYLSVRGTRQKFTGSFFCETFPGFIANLINKTLGSASTGLDFLLGKTIILAARVPFVDAQIFMTRGIEKKKTAINVHVLYFIIKIIVDNGWFLRLVESSNRKKIKN
jgi:hypothetical protein